MAISEPPPKKPRQQAYFYYFGGQFLSLTLSRSVNRWCLSLSKTYDWMSEDDKKNWSSFGEAVRKDLDVLTDAEVFLAKDKPKDKEKTDKVADKLKVMEVVKLPLSDRNVWVYSHQVTVPFSAITIRHIFKFASINPLIREELKDCTETTHHYFLEPYFHDNFHLKTCYRKYLQTALEGEKDDIQNRIKDLDRRLPQYVCHEVGTYAESFKENTWTKRLCFSMEGMDIMENCECKYTAEMAYDYEALQMQMSVSCVPSSYFLFYGAPDIIISHSMVIETSRDDSIPNVEDSSSEDDSVEFTRKPMALDPTIRLPNKLGELIAQLHFLLVAKSLRRIVKNKKKESVSCRGLLLDKQIGGYLVEMSATERDIKDTSATELCSVQVQVTNYTGAILNSSRLCFLLHALVYQR